MPLVRRLGLLASLLVAAAAWSAPALAADIAPLNRIPPVISDMRPSPGEAISVTSGVWYDEDVTGWINLPIVYSYQWQRCKRTVCTAIPGGVSQTYVVSQADAGYTLSAIVYATNSKGTGAVTSANATMGILPYTIDTDHFAVHYGSDPDIGNAINETTASDLGSLAENAYVAETGLGFPAPVSDGGLGGDSRIDVYVTATSDPWAWGEAYSETGGHGYIIVSGADPTQVAWYGGIAHELFHLVQFGIWPGAESWLLEGSAEWMAYKLDPTYRNGQAILGSWDMPLDCSDPLVATGVHCDLTERYNNAGYSRWPFYEYLAERYGNDAVRTIFVQGAAGAGSSIGAIANAIGAKGGSFTDLFTDWTVANLTGDYTMKLLQDQPPTLYGSKLAAGTLASLNAATKVGAPKLTTGAIPAENVPVPHLAARYVEIDRGDAKAPDTPCYAATLTLNVGLPSGVDARPFFWWSQKNKDGTNKETAQRLSVNGSTATITVPWDTCQWDSTPGYLVLPNPSLTADAATYAISGTLSVDRNTEATPTAPPDPVKLHGTPVDTPTSSGGGSGDVPQVAVFGPQVLRIAPDARQIRLIVQSDGSGQLKAALGSLALGTKTLRAGGNDLRFTLPTKALQGIRRVSAAASVLTLTPMSTGGAAGKPITRQVVVQAPRGR